MNTLKILVLLLISFEISGQKIKKLKSKNLDFFITNFIDFERIIQSENGISIFEYSFKNYYEASIDQLTYSNIIISVCLDGDHNFCKNYIIKKVYNPEIKVLSTGLKNNRSRFMLSHGPNDKRIQKEFELEYLAPFP